MTICFRTFAGFAAAAGLIAAAAVRAGDIAVIAHRGWYLAPSAGGAQNSIASLRAAQIAGFWGSEFDIHTTSDGVLVVWHDDKIDGVKVWEQTYERVSGYRLKNGEKIPTLDEYLEQGAKFRATRLVLEIKAEAGDKNGENALACGIADKSLDALRARNLLSPDRVMFISFSDATCRHLASVLPPGFTVQCLTARNPATILSWHAGVNGIDFEQGNYTKAANANWIETAHAAGMSVGAWTVDSTNQINKMISVGVDAITSNYPQRVRELLALAAAAGELVPVLPPPPWEECGSGTSDSVRREFCDWLETFRLVDSESDEVWSDEILALSDEDGDGMSAWAEFVAMTDPTNSASWFFATIDVGGDGIPKVDWFPNKPEDRDYVLEGADEVSGPYIPVDPAAEDGAAKSRFYRVKVLLK